MRLRFSKKTSIIAGILVVLLIAVAGFAYASVRAWDDFGLRVETVASTPEASLAELSKEGGTPAERRSAIAKLTKLSISQSNCQPDWWFGWQEGLAGKQSQLEDCQKATTRLKNIQNNSQIVGTFLADEEKLATQLNGLATSKATLADDKWADAQKNVTQVYEAIQKTESSSEFEPVKTKAASVLLQLKTAWQALTAANKKQDQSDYTKAVDKLTAAYKAIETVVPESEKQLAPLLESLQAAR